MVSRKETLSAVKDSLEGALHAKHPTDQKCDGPEKHVLLRQIFAFVTHAGHFGESGESSVEVIENAIRSLEIVFGNACSAESTLSAYIRTASAYVMLGG